MKTVYKGRKKKTIEYFAIKSVDKPQRNKILQEVSSYLFFPSFCSNFVFSISIFDFA